MTLQCCADEKRILEQLKDYCECVEDVAEKDVDELIYTVSLATGWVKNPCDTFLTGERREVVDLPSCADCPITFEPYYRPFDVDSFTFYLVKIEGIEETITEIKDFSYHQSEGLFYVDPGLPSCKCKPCTCGCPPSYKMIVEYVAGYCNIPECLLPVFCNVLEVIRAKNECNCCDDCGCENQEQKVKYASGDIVSVALETDIGKILVEQYKKQIGMLSLIRSYSKLWGFVV